ncbi:MAG: Asp-tRNA(Asn)/Glu-tRNA(Gln) amidotransferase subunit GatC [Chitinivibrionia bacterium]|nr:Asp-tRNA(Asn)/Glu-tRNA(Gln) amidotransferase subunit GatC [Chitinivibrionia bacterium]
MIEIAEVDKIANLARLAMSEEQKKESAKSLAEILDYVETLAKVDTTGVKPTAYAQATHDVLRDDIAGIEFSQEEALTNAPVAKKGHFAIPKVIG